MPFVQCRDCAFWKGQQDDAYAPRASAIRVKDPDAVDGVCRRHPPHAQPVATQNSITHEPMVGAIGIRPPVKAGDGCGDGELLPGSLGRFDS